MVILGGAPLWVLFLERERATHAVPEGVVLTTLDLE